MFKILQLYSWAYLNKNLFFYYTLGEILIQL